MIIAATGHRPNRLGGYDDEVLDKLTVLATEFLVDRRPNKVITGMAQGWDTAIALAAIDLDIPLLTALPFEGQEKRWGQRDQNRYHSILEKAAEVVVVTSHIPSTYAFHRRNIWMVDHCDLLVALWDGEGGDASGTAQCVNYAWKVGKPIINLWGMWKKR